MPLTLKCPTFAVASNELALFMIYFLILVRTKLLISAPDGILELPTIPNATDPSGPKFLAINTSNPSHVQCDSARRRVFWAESDEDTTKILEADMHPLHNGTETVFERSHIDSPYASEGNRPLNTENLQYCMSVK